MNKSPIREAIEKKVVDIINPPQNQIKKPSNRLWLAVVGFNVIFLFADFITALAVGFLTYWYYGVLVFFAGILPMIFHEGLFANPYASVAQRWTAGTGFFFSVLSALFVGVLVVVINVMFDSTPTGKTLEAVAMALLFLILIAHGALFAIYFFIDLGIRAVQNAMSAMAKNERKLNEIAMAEQIVDRSNEVVTKLESRVSKGDSALMGAAMESISGEKTELPNSSGRTG